MIRLPNKEKQVHRETCRDMTEIEKALELIDRHGCENCRRNRPSKVVIWWELGADGVDEVDLLLCATCARHFMSH